MIKYTQATGLRDDLPIPSARGRGAGQIIQKLLLNQSAFFHAPEKKDVRSIQTTACIVGGLYDKTFKTRSVVEDGQSGVRVWRTR